MNTVYLCDKEKHIKNNSVLIFNLETFLGVSSQFSLTFIGSLFYWLLHGQHVFVCFALQNRI